MPATATHALFGEDVYNKLNSYNKELIRNKYKRYLMFCQSTDPLMFYNVMNLKNGKYIRDFDHYFHKNNSKYFFNNTIKFIKDNKLYDNSDVMSFLYGFICHYVLDSNVHPYVLYYTGEFNKRIKESYKYNGLHADMETYLDNYMILKKMNKNPHSFNISNYCFDLSKFDSDLVKTLNYSFYSTFKVSNMGRIYYDSVKDMSLFLKLFRYDKYGCKLKLYNCIDFFTSKRTFKFKSLSYYVKDKDLYLNNEHNEWFYPIDKDICCNDSFDEIYDKSIKEAISIINSVNDYFYDDKKINFNNIFTNKSYITGVDCSDKRKMKYFKF